MAVTRGKNRRRSETQERQRAARAFGARLLAAFGRVTAALLLLGAVTLGGRAAYRWALTSDAFALRHLSVEGAVRADQVELCRMAGIHPGQNLLQMDLEAMTKAISQHPWVREVELTRRLPHGLSVEVKEHAPVALASLGDLYLLDDRGEPFKKLAGGDRVDLPLFTGVSRKDYMQTPQAAAARFRRALALTTLYAERAGEDAAGISEVRIEGDDLTLITRDATEIRMGEGEWEEKLARLARVRRELSRRGAAAQVIHLDNRVRPGWVAVQMSSPASERGQGSLQ